MNEMDIEKQNHSDRMSEYLIHLNSSEMALQNSIYFLCRAIHLEPKTKKEIEGISLIEMRNEMEEISQSLRNIIMEMDKTGVDNGYLYYQGFQKEISNLYGAKNRER